MTELSRELPEVDLWLHTDDIGTWPHRVAAALRLGAPAPGRLLSTGPSYAWLKIGEGCRHHCSFCTIPSIRGRHRSGPVEELEDEARALLSDGVRELVLVAQDVTAWGEDRGSNLRPLLDRLLPLPGLARLRLMYLYPAGLTDDLLDYLAGAGAPSFLTSMCLCSTPIPMCSAAWGGLARPIPRPWWTASAPASPTRPCAPP